MMSVGGVIAGSVLLASWGLVNAFATSTWGSGIEKGEGPKGEGYGQVEKATKTALIELASVTEYLGQQKFDSPDTYADAVIAAYGALDTGDVDTEFRIWVNGVKLAAERVVEASRRSLYYRDIEARMTWRERANRGGYRAVRAATESSWIKSPAVFVDRLCDTGMALYRGAFNHGVGATESERRYSLAFSNLLGKIRAAKGVHLSLAKRYGWK